MAQENNRCKWHSPSTHGDFFTLSDCEKAGGQPYFMLAFSRSLFPRPLERLVRWTSHVLAYNVVCSQMILFSNVSFIPCTCFFWQMLTCMRKCGVVGGVPDQLPKATFPVTN